MPAEWRIAQKWRKGSVLIFFASAPMESLWGKRLQEMICMKKLLIANRGEIAIRITEAAAELGLTTAAVFSEDDAKSLHVIRADEAHQLRGAGAAAYLDGEQIIAVAQEAECDAVHPGYGFLSENAAFARHCAAAGITFVGPRPELLELFGDKVRSREVARQCEVPVLAGSTGPTSLAEAQAFLQSGPAGAAIVIKAVAGGGGRGMRVVRRLEDVEEAYNRCQSEARAAFGNGAVYVERFMPTARHIEVQILGDRSGNIMHLWERECTVQRRHQKLVEMAPSPSITVETRDQLVSAALRMAQSVRYESLGTFEFLVNTTNSKEATLAFIEANPRLQVEHTVTEEVSGVDLVQAQLQLAAGQSLAELGLDTLSHGKPRGFAIELRINAESMADDASVRPANGALNVFEVPAGPGLRVDSYAYAGYSTNPRFDPLLAKLIAHSPSPHFVEAVNKAYRALCKFRIEGVTTNLGFLQALLQHPDFRANRLHTGFIEENIAELAASARSAHRRLYFERASQSRTVGAKIDASDPLAILDLGKSAAPQGEQPMHDQVVQPLPAYDLEGPEGAIALRAPMQGTIVSIDANEGAVIAQGQQLIVMEAMKMEHVLTAPVSGVLRQVSTAKGDTVAEGQPLIFIEERDVGTTVTSATSELDLDVIRPDLAEVIERHEIGLDAARPEAVARRRKTGNWQCSHA